jgi:hypothetical protein
VTAAGGPDSNVSANLSIYVTNRHDVTAETYDAHRQAILSISSVTLVADEGNDVGLAGAQAEALQEPPNGPGSRHRDNDIKFHLPRSNLACPTRTYVAVGRQLPGRCSPGTVVVEQDEVPRDVAAGLPPSDPDTGVRVFQPVGEELQGVSVLALSLSSDMALSSFSSIPGRRLRCRQPTCVAWWFRSQNDHEEPRLIFAAQYDHRPDPGHLVVIALQ